MISIKLQKTRGSIVSSYCPFNMEVCRWSILFLLLLVLHPVVIVSAVVVPGLFHEKEGKKTNSNNSNTTSTTTTTTITTDNNGNGSSNGNNDNNKITKMMGAHVDANEYDDRTLLDTFGAVAKEYLTQRVIPDTDIECKWDWRYVRCEPYCQCDFIYKHGDYHLGRSCRKRNRRRRQRQQQRRDDSNNDNDNDNDDNDNDNDNDNDEYNNNYEEFICDASELFRPPPPDNPIQLIIQKIMLLSQRSMVTITTKGKMSYEKIQNRVCTDLPIIDCTSDDILPIIAWQQRLLCTHMIPDCFIEKKKEQQQQQQQYLLSQLQQQYQTEEEDDDNDNDNNNNNDNDNDDDDDDDEEEIDKYKP